MVLSLTRLIAAAASHLALKPGYDPLALVEGADILERSVWRLDVFGHLLNLLSAAIAYNFKEVQP